MCEADKSSFAAEILATKQTIKDMSTPVKFNKVEAFPTKLHNSLVAYTGLIKDATMGDMTKGEMATCKQQLMALKKECTADAFQAKKNGKIAEGLEQSLIK